jgi:hypothetical protein
MKAIFVSDNNPAYLGFWEHQAKHMWFRFGIRTILYFLAETPDSSLFTSEYAEVRHIPLLKTVPAIVQALFAKWYFPGYETSPERIFICDIDCFVLSRRFVNHVRSGNILFHLALQPVNLPGYYVAGTPDQLRKFFRAGDISFEDFCLRALEGNTHWVPEQFATQFSKEASPDWKYFGIEENYGGKCAIAYTDPKECSIESPTPSVDRICRSKDSEFDIEHLVRGGYIDYHCPRPFEKYSTTILQILEQSDGRVLYPVTRA